MLISVLACFAAFIWQLWMLRTDRMSLGFPVAYLLSMFVQYLPGTFVDWAAGPSLDSLYYVEIGMRFTAIAVVCFVVGVWLARQSPTTAPSVPVTPDHRKFWLFCLFGGLFTNFIVHRFVADVPTIGTAVIMSGGIWMFGSMMGLRDATLRQDAKATMMWLSALAVFPVITLVNGGFLSFGAQAVIIVVCALTITTPRLWRVLAAALIVAYVGLTVFVNYFQARDNIREAAWHGGGIEQRIDASMEIVKNFQLFDPTDIFVQYALDLRLNRNYFVGLAAERIEHKEVDYLYGKTVWEAAISLVPRALWPGKPVLGGGGNLAADMTGLQLSEKASWGVGSVMEFQINFGTPGVIIGFLLLGWLIGTLDRKAAIANASGELPKAILYFLPAIPLMQPLDSLAEMVGGAAITLVAAYGWKIVWEQWACRITLGTQKA
jgi:hypothetical protein